ncbi:MAG: extracellular solute-binding protein [Treponema sp.]|jgi:multiple sugar transport system substrate-binding protein|nr:extracellular solute-binding protein [Treponema sp.]
MNLLEKLSIIKVYIKKLKKSIHINNRMDVFIIATLLVLAVITPIIISLSVKIEAAAKQRVLYLSSNCEEFFGKKMMETLILEFQEKNPDILIRMTNGEATHEPDILLFDEGSLNALVAEGALARLNPFTNFDSGKQQLAVPLVSFMDVLFYNIDILTAAGFYYPPKTRAEFTTFARTISRGEFGASGAAISLSPEDLQAPARDIFSWIWAGGGNFWRDEEGPSISTRVITNDIAFLGTLYSEEILAPGVFETTGEQRLEEFAQGKIAMMVASTRAIPYLRERMGDTAFGITTIPGSGTGGKYSAAFSAIYAGINSNSAHIEEAWSFLVFLAEKSFLFCEELKAVPGVVSDIIRGDYIKADPFYSKAWDIFESSGIAEGFSGNLYAQEYETAFMEELQIFFETGRTAQQTIAAIQQRWNVITEKALPEETETEGEKAQDEVIQDEAA